MNSKCSACSAQYQNISLYIKGQKSSNSDTRLIVCYVFNIQVFIASFDYSFYRYLYKYDFTLIMFILSLIHESD